MSYKYFGHNLIIGKLVLMADNVAIIVLADVIAFVADGMATGSIVLSYFILSSEMLNRT